MLMKMNAGLRSLIERCLQQAKDAGHVEGIRHWQSQLDALNKMEARSPSKNFNAKSPKQHAAR
jgi:hypothetical protein